MNPIQIPVLGSLWRAKPQTLMHGTFAPNRHLPNQYFRIGDVPDGKVATEHTKLIAVSEVSAWEGTVRELNELFTPQETPQGVTA